MNRKWATAIVLVMHILAACSDGPEITPPDGGGARITGQSGTMQGATLVPDAGRNAVHRPYITPSQRIAAQLPHFAGAYRDAEGRLTVTLTDMTARPEAEQAVSAVLRQIGRAEMEVVYAPAARSFRALDEWMQVLAAAGVPGAAGFGIDERSNRLRVDATSAGAVPRIRALLDGLGIPRDAVALEVTGPISNAASLQGRVRPVLGGIQTRTNTNDSDRRPICTYGPNVLYGSERNMITNSHCTWGTSQTGGWIGAELYQHDLPTWEADRGHYLYGIEVQDPAYSPSIYGCPAGYLCRYSDAARVSLDAWSTSTDWDLGGIARTTSRAVLPTIHGSLTINSNSSTFQILGVASDIFVGDFAEKVGRTTGWTGGNVTSTCYTVVVAPHAYPCQVEVAAGVGSGDSGSPVFWLSSSGHRLFGLLFAGLISPTTGTGERLYFSKWRDVDYELGTINADLIPFDAGSGGGSGGGGGGGDCTTNPSLPC